MTVIDSGACRTSSGAGQTAATQASNGLRGSSFQDRADALVRATVLSDLGQGAGDGRHSHGIQGVAAAIRKVLSAQDVTGTDASDDVLKKIETSLHKAAQALNTPATLSPAPSEQVTRITGGSLSGQPERHQAFANSFNLAIRTSAGGCES